MPDRDRWLFGKGKSTSTGLYKDVFASTQGQTPYYSSIPADWPWSKAFKRKYSKNRAFNKSEAMTFSDPQTPDEKRDLEKNRKRAEQAITKALAKKESHSDFTEQDMVPAIVDSYIHLTGDVSCDEDTLTEFTAEEGTLKAMSEDNERHDDSSHRRDSTHSGNDYTGYSADMLIESVIDGEDPAELIEKVSYAYDIRLDQNIEVGPTRKVYGGYYTTVQGRNRVTDCYESLKEARRKKRTPFYQMGLDAYEKGIESPAIVMNPEVNKKWLALEKSKSHKEMQKAGKDYIDGWHQAKLNSGVSSKYLRAMEVPGMTNPDDPEPMFDHRQKVVVTAKSKSKFDQEYYGNKKLYIIWQIGDYDPDRESRAYQFMDTKTKKRTWWHYPSEHFSARSFMKNKDVKGKTYVESLQEKKKRLPDAAYSLLKTARLYPPKETKYISKPQMKYLDEFVKRGFVVYVNKGKYGEAIKITDKGREAFMNDEW